MRPDNEEKVADNVVSLFAAKAKLEEAESSNGKEGSVKSLKAEEDTSFADEVSRNKQVADRMKKEREKANRSVLRSYRLKT